MKYRAFSLRMKLTLWFLLIFVAIQATLTTAALLFRQRRTGEFLDAQLLKWERAISRRLAVKQPRWTWTEEYLAAAVPLDVDLEFVVIRDAEGHEVVSIGDVDIRYLPPLEPGSDAMAAKPRLATIEAEQAAPLARVEQPLRRSLLPAGGGDQGCAGRDARAGARSLDRCRPHQPVCRGSCRMVPRRPRRRADAAAQRGHAVRLAGDHRNPGGDRTAGA